MPVAEKTVRITEEQQIEKSIVWQSVANIKNVHAVNITYIIFANVCFNNTYLD